MFILLQQLEKMLSIPFRGLHKESYIYLLILTQGTLFRFYRPGIRQRGLEAVNQTIEAYRRIKDFINNVRIV